MMIKPPVTELVRKIGSRYKLVVATAKRARQLVGGAAPLAETSSDKEVSIATEEIYEDKVGVISPENFF